MKEFRRSVWIGFIWSIVFGTMLHFLYGWTGENRVVGLYAAVSESTWEHLKLLFFPVLLYTVWEYMAGTPLERLRTGTGRGCAAGNADHYGAVLYLHRHLWQALAVGRYPHLCAGCGCHCILHLEIRPARTWQQRVRRSCPCSHSRLLWRVQPVSACGGNFCNPISIRAVLLRDCPFSAPFFRFSHKM